MSERLNCSKYPTYLGFTLDSEVNCGKHIEKIADKRDSSLNYMRKNGFIDFNVDTSTPLSCITPIDSFNNVEFREELLTSTPKHSSHPELLRQLVLKVIHDIPDQALIVYTDCSRSDTGSGRGSRVV
ncbi:RNase H domain-containing protein [Trichonephila clavipes]|nr:RNase H domain-containing protein [Trichonephila clavipes]